MDHENHSHLHAALRSMTSDPKVLEWIDGLGIGDDLTPDAARSGYAVIRDAVTADRYDAMHHGPEPEVDIERLLDAESFRLATARVVELLPETDGVSVPQVVLAMEGTPMTMTLTGSKTYLTAFPGELAMGVGKAMLESGKVITKATRALADELATDERIPGARQALVTATPADMAREAANARAQDALRSAG